MERGSTKTHYSHVVLYDQSPEKDFHHLEVVTITNCGMTRDQAHVLRLTRKGRLEKRHLDIYGSSAGCNPHEHRIIAKVEKGENNTYAVRTFNASNKCQTHFLSRLANNAWTAGRASAVHVSGTVPPMRARVTMEL